MGRGVGGGEGKDSPGKKGLLAWCCSQTRGSCQDSVAVVGCCLLSGDPMVSNHNTFLVPSVIHIAAVTIPFLISLLLPVNCSDNNP